MNFASIIRDPLFHLPIKQEKEDFRATIDKRLKQFLEKVDSLTSLDILDAPFSVDFVKRVQHNFVGGLMKTLDAYYNGSPFKAYQQLDRTLRSDLKNFAEILKFKEYMVGEDFYRIRIKKENFPLESRDMFHVPFEDRDIVSTQRYSIPGFPCLYLGATIYGCWEEMNRPAISDFQVARLTNTESIRCLDLTRPISDEDVPTEEWYRYFMTWPLIACCSVKVKNPIAPFKSEYIIPQLLLQWVRNDERIGGIRYTSTHIDIHSTDSEGDFSNVALPVRTSSKKGHCPRLKKLFAITEPISWQLKQYASGGGLFLHNRNEYDPINEKIPRLELIKGRAYPYSYSVLGELELFLNGMPTKSLK